MPMGVNALNNGEEGSDIELEKDALEELDGREENGFAY